MFVIRSYTHPLNTLHHPAYYSYNGILKQDILWEAVEKVARSETFSIPFISGPKTSQDNKFHENISKIVNSRLDRRRPNGQTERKA